MAQAGTAYTYTGAWGHRFVEISVDFDLFAMNRGGVLAAIAIDPEKGTMTVSVPALQ